MPTDLENKLLYRCLHRGCKETDFLLGKFGEAKLLQMNVEEQNCFDSFLNEDDMLIYDWILSKQECPNKYEGLIKQIQIFHKI
ncbi:MAG: succinate dehydrogenase assembly factor 2 [Rickettsiales bacterium]|nr:succinate dehydrogenase assembly factor 2 [Rickettsiales bacterium]